jgi:hypothetical protein
MLILIIPPDIVDKLRTIEFPKGNALDPIPGNLNGKDIFWLPADLRDATYIDNDGNEQSLYKEVLADFDSCDSKDIDTIENKYYDEKDNEIVPEVTETVTIIEKTTTGINGERTIEREPIGDPIIESIYKDTGGNILNVLELKSKTVLIETISGKESIWKSISVFASERISDVVDGITWIWNGITNWFKS